jgi:hypothetical protein
LVEYKVGETIREGNVVLKVVGFDHKCEKCNVEDSTVRAIGSKHTHYLCKNCRRKWGKFMDEKEHRNKLNGLKGQTFHTLWEELMEEFIGYKEKVQFTSAVNFPRDLLPVALVPSAISA